MTSSPTAPASPEASPLSARSLVASTLLGTYPPRLPGRLLVRFAVEFGIAEGTTRVALSRMVAAGELVADDGVYELTGRLRDRQHRQELSRRPQLATWDGTWDLALVHDGRRSPAERHDLREAMRALRLAELRDGVWTRPANLDPERLPDAAEVVDRQCRWLRSTLREGDDAELAASLWDPPSWIDRASELCDAMAAVVDDLEANRTAALADGFVLAAAVLRHLLADPLLPEPLLPSTWNGSSLRTHYDRYDVAYRALLREWFGNQRR